MNFKLFILCRIQDLGNHHEGLSHPEIATARDARKADGKYKNIPTVIKNLAREVKVGNAIKAKDDPVTKLVENDVHVIDNNESISEAGDNSIRKDFDNRSVAELLKPITEVPVIKDEVNSVSRVANNGVTAAEATNNDDEAENTPKNEDVNGDKLKLLKGYQKFGGGKQLQEHDTNIYV